MSGAHRSSSAVSHVVCGSPGRVAQATTFLMSNAGNKWLRVAFHNRLNALAFSEVGDTLYGCYFGIFLLATQKKDTRLSGETDDFAQLELNTI